MEKYPSLVEGTGLENREAAKATQGFESLFLRHSFIAGWSSSVARRAHNPKVVGSNPAPATNLRSVSLEAYDVCLSRRRSRVRIPYGPPLFGFIAQSVEQRTENPRVTGSIPVEATILFINSCFYKSFCFILYYFILKTISFF